MPKPLGLYVHFPYCTKRCPYCDFAIAVRKRIPHERYRDRVLAELATRAPLFADRELVSIYFGGGTPGLWSPACIGAVIASARTTFANRLREVTVEVNPGDLDLDALPLLASAGVTRLSVGAQRFTGQRLAELGRWHVPEETRALVARAQSIGAFAITIDLMFSLPNETAEELDRELDALLALDVPHVSTYSLTIEPRTAFAAAAKRGRLRVLPEDDSADRYEQVIDRLTRAGLQQYEVSSFARPGFEAVHNSLYWTGADYLGIGSSASSLRVGADGASERWRNQKNVDQYLATTALATHEADPLIVERETMSLDASEREAVWLGLRRNAGIDRAEHARRFGHDPLVPRAALVAQLVAEALAEVDATHVRLTRRGRLQSDAIAIRLL